MMRSRRGQAAEVPPERVFGRLWGRMTDQGWRVMAKPHWFARGDPRTWIYCAPEVLDAAGKLRRDAGELGESIFLDKDDLWTWAERSGWALPADDDDDATGDRETENTVYRYLIAISKLRLGILTEQGEGS